MKPIRYGELHPLQNPAILELIFDNCTVTDLRACRLVSKIWHETSLKPWTTSVQVSMNYGSDEWSMAPFLEFVEGDNSNYFEAPFVTSYCLKNEKASQFWSVCGSAVKELVIDDAQFESLEAFRDAIYTSCPNLEKLILRNVYIAGEKEKVVEPETKLVETKFGENRKLKSLSVCHRVGLLPSWMELLSHFPSIEELNADLYERKTTYDELFTSLILIRERFPWKLKIRNVSTPVPYDVKIPLSLFHALEDLPLQSLSIPLQSLEEMRQFRNLLRVHGENLKSLVFLPKTTSHTLDPKEFFGDFRLNFEKLEQLEFHSSYFSSLEFLEFTPNLKTLVLRNISVPAFSQTNWSEMFGVLFSKCKELELTGFKICGPPTTEEFRNLIERFPNLETLFVDRLDNDKFAVVCECLPHLTSLEIEDSELNDYGICGLDVGDVATINRQGEHCTWRPVYPRRPSITSLRNLQSFSMIGKDRGRRIEMGKCPALCGVLELPQLRHFRIKGYNFQGKMFWRTLHSQFPWPTPPEWWEI